MFFYDFDKNGTNNEKNTKVSANTSEHSGRPQSKFQCCSVFVLELLGFAFYKYFVFLCFFMDSDKNGINKWKNTKVSANTSEQSGRPQRKFQCHSFLCSWVIRVCFLCIFYIFMLFYDFDKNVTNYWKNTKLCESYLDHWGMSQTKFQCLRWFGSWVIRVSLYVDILYFYALLQTLKKMEQTIEKPPNFMEVIISAWTTDNQKFNLLGRLVLQLLSLKLC